MYVEDTGTGDGDIDITVNGSEHTAEANYDLDRDGVDETVGVLTEDGYLAYTDSDSDGTADLLRTFDEQGTVLSRSRFDEATGQWVPEQPEGPEHRDHSERDPRSAAGGDPMVVDTPAGDRHIGPPTEDTDNDGRPDTTVVDTEDGQMLVTDVNGDGAADQMVRISDTGRITVARHTGGGEWTVLEHGGLDGTPTESSGASAPVTGTEDWLWESGETGQSPRSQPFPAPRQADPAEDSFWE